MFSICFRYFKFGHKLRDKSFISQVYLDVLPFIIMIMNRKRMCSFRKCTPGLETKVLKYIGMLLTNFKSEKALHYDETRIFCLSFSVYAFACSYCVFEQNFYSYQLNKKESKEIYACICRFILLIWCQISVEPNTITMHISTYNQYSCYFNQIITAQ